MGATTVAIDTSGYSPVDSSAGYEVRGVVTMSSSYSTGGDSITAAQLGLGVIAKLLVDSAGGYVLRYNSTNGTIQAYDTGAASGSPLAEAASTTNLSTVAANFVAWGT